ncbi:MFS transporter [candidate division WWE3 bacterium]|uniref:MFS transporter n=1 Tax=candidate division WWE3 bacterium TaxID=2053526 RepID=A0A955RSA9_UNCKA|nr:MFS transporter [candidate division WWE3 bacterium]
MFRHLSSVFRKFFPQGNVGKMNAIVFFNSLQFFGAVLVPMLTDWGGLTYAQAMLLQSIFVLSNTLLEIPTGVVADKWGRKASIVLGVIFGMVGLTIYGFNKEFYSFAIGEIALALGMSLMSGADTAMIYDSLKEKGEESKAGSAFGMFGVVHMFGLMLATPMGSGIAQYLNLIAPMRFTAIPMVLSLAVALTLKEPALPAHVQQPVPRLSKFFAGVSILRSNDRLRSLALDLTIVAVAGRAMIWLYQPLLQYVGLPIFVFGFVSATFICVELLVMSNVDRLDRVMRGRENVFTLGRIVTMFGFAIGVCALTAVLAVGQGPLAIVLGLLSPILGVGFSLSRKPFFDDSMNEHISSDVRATVLSTVKMMSSAVLIFLNPLIGWSADRSLIIPFVFLTLILLVWSVYKQFR